MHAYVLNMKYNLLNVRLAVIFTDFPRTGRSGVTCKLLSRSESLALPAEGAKSTCMRFRWLAIAYSFQHLYSISMQGPTLMHCDIILHT